MYSIVYMCNIYGVISCIRENICHTPYQCTYTVNEGDKMRERQSLISIIIFIVSLS